jgi:hypothetical protein
MEKREVKLEIMRKIFKNMFNKDKIKSGDIINDSFENKVKCSDCHCWLGKVDAQKVGIHYDFSWYEASQAFYCGAHRKPYFKIKLGSSFPVPPQYFGEIQMTEAGEPIGYKKVDDKNK